jgi:hypothetical protein
MEHQTPSLENIQYDPMAYHNALRTGSLGTYYGYPECCVRAFRTGQAKKFHPTLHTSANRNPFTGTGYLPCQTCHETKTPYQIYQTLCANRQDPAPFPMQSNEFVEEIMEDTELWNRLLRAYHRFHNFLKREVANVPVLEQN